MVLQETSHNGEKSRRSPKIELAPKSKNQRHPQNLLVHQIEVDVDEVASMDIVVDEAAERNAFVVQDVAHEGGLLQMALELLWSKKVLQSQVMSL